MKEPTKKDLSKIVKRIQENNFSGIEIRALLTNLCFSGLERIKDLANFITHEGERDRGILYDNVKSFIDGFIIFNESGGSVFTQVIIVDDLCQALKAENISNLNEEKFKLRSFEIMLIILELVSDTEIVIKHPRIKRASTSGIETTPAGSCVYISFEPIPFPRDTLVARIVRTEALVASK